MEKLGFTRRFYVHHLEEEASNWTRNTYLTVEDALSEISGWIKKTLCGK